MTSNDAYCILSPYFHKIYKFPPISANFIIFPLYFRSILWFLLNLHSLPPHFDHDAFMHHALHELTRTGCPLTVVGHRGMCCHMDLKYVLCYNVAVGILSLSVFLSVSVCLCLCLSACLSVSNCLSLSLSGLTQMTSLHLLHQEVGLLTT